MSYSLDDVFGVSRDIPLTYVERAFVDDLLKESLTRKQHIVIYGSSKQGKTSLRKKCMAHDSFLSVHCAHHFEISTLNQQILKEAGFKIVNSHNKTISGKAKAKASFGLNLFTKIMGETEIEGSIQNELTIKELELDLEDTNDIIRALKSINFKKIIVLEDFHYLKHTTQRDFAFALKSYYENSDFSFIIVGVWLEKNRLIALNGDLAGRLVPIDVEKWTTEDLRRVISKGEDLLNITFSDHVIDQILEESFNNIYILQEICHRVCSRYKVFKRQETNFTIGLIDIGDSENSILRRDDSLSISSFVQDIIMQHTGRYHSFVLQFSDGLQNSDIETYRWILFPILTCNIDTLSQGLSFNEIKDSIQNQQMGGKVLNSTNLSVALKSLTHLQIEKGITPNIIDYDQTNMRLNIVDKEFIIWRSYQSGEELIKMAGLTIKN